MFDFDNKNQKDSFCALIYYIHILGDRIADEKYYENAVIMELGGRSDKQDITHELITNIEILFSDQKHTYKYQHVISKLESYDNKISDLKKRTNGVYKGDDFKEYREYANGIMEVLMYNIPEMLKSERFFYEVFY